MKSNKKMALIGTVVGLICGLAGMLGGFYIDVLKPLLASGAWTQVSNSTLITSAVLIVLLIGGLVLFARRALIKHRTAATAQDAW